MAHLQHAVWVTYWKPATEKGMLQSADIEDVINCTQTVDQLGAGQYSDFVYQLRFSRFSIGMPSSKLRHFV